MVLNTVQQKLASLSSLGILKAQRKNGYVKRYTFGHDHNWMFAVGTHIHVHDLWYCRDEQNEYTPIAVSIGLWGLYVSMTFHSVFS